MWSGNANKNGSCILDDNNSHSMRVEPGTGTGVDKSRNIQVSISLTSYNAEDGRCSVD